MKPHTKRWLLSSAMVIALGAPRTAAAFSGFYVSGADGALQNRATHVVLMREGTRTVVSMQPHYEGPAEHFAIVIPVPAGLSKEDVKTLPAELFARLERLTAPRIVEYWEEDPCGVAGAPDGSDGGGVAPSQSEAEARPSVTVESRFAVGEYAIEVLGAKDSTTLAAWLDEQGYALPKDAEPLLRPYVDEGMRFFAAKVDASKVKLVGGKAALSPLRFHYDADDFTLPLRLGLLNAPDGAGAAQDLIVHILARGDRYEAAGVDNVFIPTNLDVTESARSSFAPLYAALFDRALEVHPGAVVTEYAWDARTCDPCPGPPLGPSDLATLGADVLADPKPADGGRAPDADAGAPAAETRMVGEIVVGTVDAPRPVVQEVGSMVPGFRRCLQKAREDQPRIDGSLRLEIAVRPDGTPDLVSSKGGEALPRRLVTCLKARASLSKLPPTPGRGVKIEVPLEIRSVPAPAPVTIEGSFVLTRLHARYDKSSLAGDLTFQKAAPISGGREVHGADGNPERGVTPSEVNRFQARYAIRHPFTGAVTCADPKRGVWRTSIAGQANSMRATPALGLGLVERGRVDLATHLVSDVAELGVTASGKPPAGVAAIDAGLASSPSGADNGGCGSCSESGRAPLGRGWGALLLGAAWLLRRRNRR